MGVASPVLPALAHTLNVPRRGVGWGVNPGRSGSSRSFCHTLDAAGVVGGGVAGAEPPHKGGPNRPDRPNARGEGREKPALASSGVTHQIRLSSCVSSIFSSLLRHQDLNRIDALVRAAAIFDPRQ